MEKSVFCYIICPEQVYSRSQLLVGRETQLVWNKRWIFLLFFTGNRHKTPFPIGVSTGSNKVVTSGGKRKSPHEV